MINYIVLLSEQSKYISFIRMFFVFTFKNVREMCESKASKLYVNYIKCKWSPCVVIWRKNATGIIHFICFIACLSSSLLYETNLSTKSNFFEKKNQCLKKVDCLILYYKVKVTWLIMEFWVKRNDFMLCSFPPQKISQSQKEPCSLPAIRCRPFWEKEPLGKLLGVWIL